MPFSFQAFLTRQRPAELERAIQRLEKYLNTEPGTLVITANATAATNAVLRDFPWKEDDMVLTYSTVYPSLARTLQYVQDRHRSPVSYPNVESIPLVYPCNKNEVLGQTRNKLKEMQRQGKLPRMAVFDTISSRPGVMMPFYELAALFRSYGVLTFVDGAHGLGAIPIDLARLDPDFFVSNAHKWMMAPRGNAVLVVAPRNADKVLSSVPTTWAFSWKAMWAMPGTNDFAHALSINAALDFYERIGGEAKVHPYLRLLSIEGGEAAARVLGTRSMRLTPAEAGSEGDLDQLTCITANLQLPLKKEVWGVASVWGEGWTKPGGINDFFQTHLYDDFNTIIPIYETGGELWARISSQVFLEVSDFVYGANVRIRILSFPLVSIVLTWCFFFFRRL